MGIVESCCQYADCGCGSGSGRRRRAGGSDRLVESVRFEALSSLGIHPKRVPELRDSWPRWGRKSVAPAAIANLRSGYTAQIQPLVTTAPGGVATANLSSSAADCQRRAPARHGCPKDADDHGHHQPQRRGQCGLPGETLRERRGRKQHEQPAGVAGVHPHGQQQAPGVGNHPRARKSRPACLLERRSDDPDRRQGPLGARRSHRGCKKTAAHSTAITSTQRACSTNPASASRVANAAASIGVDAAPRGPPAMPLSSDWRCPGPEAWRRR